MVYWQGWLLYFRYYYVRFLNSFLETLLLEKGDISTEIFRDNCEFTDPTNSVSSLAKYQKALTILFNPEQSFVELVTPLEIDVPKREITGRIRSGGVLKLPWNPRISSYESTIKWKIDDDGLIESQIQQWSIPASQALRETFTPSF
ncbi:DUF2358 domain-containing protein [Skeletonema marinoi]|uniref:DUF2358 domain-containing protein n=1 Tax=Skeletonema marinoi TaxID=267567 RepID=A0AAD8Y5V6_9STRA|nr:DUF2358 domain-containing protein [Skeletonema marinoi]